MAKNRVLVIIVTYNAMKWAERCFESLRQSDEKADAYIIDNGSTDGTQNYIKQNYKEFLFLQSQANLGFGRANNIGLRYALKENYQYVYLLNQDAWIMPDTLTKLIEVHTKYLEFAILSPMQMQANMQYLDDNFIEFTCCFHSNKNLISDFYLQNNKEIYEVNFVMAAHWFIPTAILRKVGLFSPSFPHYREDNNFIIRAQYYGYKVGIVPLAKAVHDRADRGTTKQKEMHLLYTMVISMLSDPTKNYKLYTNSLVFIKAAVKYKSIIPIKHLWMLWKKYSFIKRNKYITKHSDGAFINSNS